MAAGDDADAHTMARVDCKIWGRQMHDKEGSFSEPDNVRRSEASFDFYTFFTANYSSNLCFLCIHAHVI